MSSAPVSAGGRLTVLVAAGTTHLLLGGVYAWSVYATRLEAEHGFSRVETQLVFGTTIATFTVAMIGAGRVIERVGARQLIRLAAVSYAAGYLLAAGFGATVSATLAGVGLLSGVGIGLGYVSALTAAVAAFERRRGLVTGLVTGAFAGGSALLAPLIHWALARGLPVPTVFVVHGLIGSLGLLVASSAIGDLGAHAPSTTPVASPLALRRVLAINAFGLFASSLAGLLVIGGLAALTAGRLGDPSIGASAVVAFSLGNTVGRPAWGAVDDRLWRVSPSLSLAVLAAAVVSLSAAGSSAALTLGSCFLTGFGFAAGFVVYAANTVRHFGAASLGALYPWVFLAYGAAALVGPPLGGLLHEVSGSSHGALLAAAGLAVVAAVVLGASEHAARPRAGADRDRLSVLPASRGAAGRESLVP